MKFPESLLHFLPSGAQLNDREVFWPSHPFKKCTNSFGHQNSEHRLDLFSRVKISMRAEWIACSPVITELGVVKRGVHKPVKWNRPCPPDFVPQNLSDGRHISRLCGVRMNISTR